MNGKTDRKPAPQWRKSAVDKCLSVNHIAPEISGCRAFALENRPRNAAGRNALWKTKRAGMTRQRHPALPTRERTA